ncbi:MAG: AbrB/MazE/SpoVT family DNA-binding domain-containing protein [Abditibacteriales bacterium]|nr:AbrB/MazE/SpoVT family DNA-binding domain-containing protein [Abditibacteriales bacterium]MDW8364253.1 AbrB/MazE/SpoVT family DNA-binding domain-containing protein [Abditibacteriales bacterium]
MLSAQVRIREDGSVPLPQALLDAVRLKPHDEVVVFEEEGHLVMMTREQLADEIVRLLEPLKDADWEQIEREREDDPQRV